MDNRKSIQDKVLGTITWDISDSCWIFGLRFPSGQTVSGTILCEDPAAPLESQGLSVISDRMDWLIDNELRIRDHITEKLFDLWRSNWCDEESGAAINKPRFRDMIVLSELNVDEDFWVSLYYNDRDLFCGHAIVQDIQPDGTLHKEPYLFG